MKRSEHKCAACGCPRQKEYPFCAVCWRRVPKDLQAPVLAALETRGTPDLDRSALALSVMAAAESIREVNATPRTLFWERAYRTAGSPFFDTRENGSL
jgi:hypothetical protein